MHLSPLIIKKRIFLKIVLDIGNTYCYTYIIKKRQALKGKEETMKDLNDYIDSLDTAGLTYSREEWVEVIIDEQMDFMRQDERVQPLTDAEIRHIIETLAKDGFVK
jgi:hypothetical protein